VEDNPGDVVLVREALELHGIAGELLVLSDGEKAIWFIEDLDKQSGACPGLIIIDLNLPKRSGLEVLQHVQLSPTCRKAPVVILSSSDTPQDKAEATRLGANRYIRKPSRLEDFLELGAIFRITISNSDQ
jgi:CheY-like chemotaxis protein